MIADEGAGSAISLDMFSSNFRCIVICTFTGVISRRFSASRPKICMINARWREAGLKIRQYFQNGRVTRNPVTPGDKFGNAMSNIDLKPKLQQKTKVQKPKLYKVVLLNDDFTPREFVVLILKGEFRLDSSQAEVVMLTAHQKGVCVVSVYPKDVAETKATRAIDAAGRLGYPLQFTVEPE
jgi:ATP-dependent Clp protease adaptor protein ClpS